VARALADALDPGAVMLGLWVLKGSRTF
jgi:hypothetical protein